MVLWIVISPAAGGWTVPSAPAFLLVLWAPLAPGSPSAQGSPPCLSGRGGLEFQGRPERGRLGEQGEREKEREGGRSLINPQHAPYAMLYHFSFWSLCLKNAQTTGLSLKALYSRLSQAKLKKKKKTPNTILK